MSDNSTMETITRRPEYIERFEKALLSGIFGQEATMDMYDPSVSPLSGDALIAKVNDILTFIIQPQFN